MKIIIQTTNNINLAKKIVEKLKENDGYCPCAIEKNADTKCMCADFRNKKEGFCHCGLYYKTIIND